MAKVIGIDLGMTNSRVAVLEDGKAIVLTNRDGFLATPSVIGYAKNGVSEAGSKSHRLIGQIAKRQAVINNQNTIHSVKRFIGRKYDEVTQEISRVSYEVLAASDGGITINCPNAGAQFTPEEISAQILRQLVDAASVYLGEDVTQAVITVPAYFTDAQRQATKDAGKLAGLEVLRIINEPTAACLAHGLDKRIQETFLVFDLGGETLDISVLEVGDGVFEILSTSSDFHLGGNNFEQKIVDWLADEFQRQENIDLRQDKQALQRLVEAAEHAKIELSSLTQTQAEIDLPFIAATEDGPKHLNATLTQTKFEEMCSELLDSCRISIEQVFQEAKLKISDINEVVLVGGSTHIPAVQELVRQFTGKEPIQGINPEEAVALGAAIQASVLSGRVDYGCISWCMTSLSLGIETQHGLMTKLIDRNTFLPIRKSQVFSTETDGQTSVEINILRGERPFAKDNKSLGILRLDGIPLAPKGVPQIEVIFNVDHNEILSVTAKDLATGKEVSMVLVHALTVDRYEVERMRVDAERQFEEDRKLLEPIQAREQVKSVVWEAERHLTELVEKLSSVDKEWVEGLVSNLRDVTQKQSGCCQQAQLPVSNPAFVLAGTPTSSAMAALCGS
ncbi:molecular chaperone DnaK [Allocoleopsis sp.]|uniref:molecular chaperone DnaK n=1 Tax=Allocoleopsis sp. TaxID=3088169 RepID=UPI0032C24078